ncbi:MAG: AI-2E family transporter [Bacteroidetes bacterium]|nr:AI-2E family transporter [Bacteroidota bacterium]HET6242921.1 AI-2E family transporter [Bacteroidia bacterium]
MDKIKPEVFRQLFALFSILLLGGLIFLELSPYLSGILGAFTIYIILRKLMSNLLLRGWKPSTAAVTLMIASFLCFLLPVTAVVIMISNKISKAIKHSEKILAFIEDKAKFAENYLGFDITKNIDTSQASSYVATTLESLAGGTFTIIIAIGIMYFILYYLFVNTEKLKELAIEYLPLKEENILAIGNDSNELVKSNAIGIPIVALLQGTIALIGYLILGVPDPIFWFTITAISSMIPFVGTAMGVLPVCILLFSMGQNWQAIALLIYGVAVVGASDNFFRLVIQRKLANVHPLITLFGVIVGVPLFGFIGLIFGPLLVSLFLLLVRIYKNEYGKQGGQSL